MSKGIRTSKLDEPININKKKGRLRLTDKINQTICSRGSISTGKQIVMRDVKNVFSQSDGTLKGTTLLTKDKKVSVVFNIRLSAWVYED